MKSFRLSSLLFAAIALCAYAFSTFCATAADLVVSTARAVKNWALDGFKLAAAAEAEKTRTVLPFVQARSFFGRLVKRERVQMTAGWRRCAST